MEPGRGISDHGPILPAAGTGGRAGRIRLVVILGSVGAFAPLSIDAYLPGLPGLSHDLHASASAAQATLTGCLIGLAAGQLLVGPLSDKLGRRRPLLAGIAAYTVTSLLCAFAPSVWLLVVLRLVQGLTGAAGIVIARAIVRDLYSGSEAARFFSRLMLVTGVAPILAPILGAQLLYFTSWRGIFFALAAIGALLFAGGLRLEETLPPELRHAGGLRETLGTIRDLMADRRFVGYILSCGLPFAAMFAYIAGSPFVLQDIYGLSPQLYGVVFGVNAVCLVAATQAGAAFVDRIGPGGVVAVGLWMGIGGAGFLTAAILLHAGLTGVLPALLLVVASVGLVLPNGTALALADHREAAGSASALVGLFQFVVGAVAAPIVGVGGRHTAIPMTLAILGFEVAGLAIFLGLTGRGISGQPRRPER